MMRLPSPFQPMLAGLILTLAQIATAVCLLAPPGPFSYRYSTLIQHDSYWFMNIVDRGYATTSAADRSQSHGSLQCRVFFRLIPRFGFAALWIPTWKLERRCCRSPNCCLGILELFFSFL